MQQQEQQDPVAPLPTNSNEFTFVCSCLNVLIDGRVPTDFCPPAPELDPPTSSELRSFWIEVKGEKSRHPSYITWDQNGSRPGRSKPPTGKEDDSDGDDDLGPSWRTCWICKVKLYRVNGKSKDSGPAERAWVTIDLKSGIVWEPDLEPKCKKKLLSFSWLDLPIPSIPSNFGRSPRPVTPPQYGPGGSPLNSPPGSPKELPQLIPPVHDPFFLPPPFIPSHPHLRELCDDAVSHLKEQHRRLEGDIKEYIASKAREMTELAELVRAEVELLWTKYRDVPGKADELERSRSASMTRNGGTERLERRKSRDVSSLAFKPSPVNNPIVDQAIVSPTFAPETSLLAASLSANTFHAPPPRKVSNEVDDSISELTKKTERASDARAVAISHVFSVLDDVMGEQSGRRRRPSEQKTEMQIEKEAQEELDRMREAEESKKDSWIDGERKLLGLKVDGQDEMDSMTPRPPLRKKLSGKGRERAKAVTFEEPGKLDNEVARPDEANSGDEDPEDVFDFEPDPPPPEPVDPHDPIPFVMSPPRNISRTRNIVEENLSRTFAADAPSHRAAWRRFEERRSIVASLRKPSPDSYTEENEEAAISKLATSVPVNITFTPPSRRGLPGLAMERKTSLNEREGILVPSLLAAMRERGITSNALGLLASADRPTRVESSRTRGSRSASVSREREQAKSYSADPGAVFESMADEDEEDESDEEEGQGGTLRDNRTFVPPHVIARRESNKDGKPEIGWRSMAN